MSEPTLELLRKARLFVRRPGALSRLESERSARLRLAPDQIHHPDVPGDFVVRHGRIRLSEFLPDGREVCRAILQAGFCFTIHAPAAAGRTGTALGACVLMALGEAELWQLPTGALGRLDATADFTVEEYR
jgi:hypothetical protein